MLTGRESAALKRLGRSEEGDTETAADLVFGASITSHNKYKLKVKNVGLITRGALS